LRLSGSQTFLKLSLKHHIMANAFFIIGCARSGTTAYARMLGTAANANVYIEQSPRLRKVSRDLLEGHLADPAQTLNHAKNQQLKNSWLEGKIYGDKNPCYLPFIPSIIELWDAKIIFIVRDGRDVVTSLMNWHELFALNIYASHEDTDDADPSNIDLWDYSRPRPLPNEDLHGAWKSMSRFEKCCWYWSFFNDKALTLLDKLDSSLWLPIQANASLDQLKNAFDFLELTGFQSENLTTMLSAKINSAYDRTKRQNVFPSWQEWSLAEQTRFEELAGGTTASLIKRGLL
jgi:hypothetical protein